MKLTHEDLDRLSADLSERVTRLGGDLNRGNAAVVLTAMLGGSPKTVAVALRTDANMKALYEAMEEVGL